MSLSGCVVSYKQRKSTWPTHDLTGDIVLQLVSQGIDITVLNEENLCALHYCTDAQAVFLLVKLGINVNQGPEVGQIPPIFYAYNADVAQAMIEAGADLTIRDKRGRTCIFNTYDPFVAQVLIDGGANINAVDNYGNDAFEDCPNDEVKLVFIRNGILLDLQRSSIEQFWMEADSVEIVKAFLDRGVNINHQDKYGNTILHNVHVLDVAKYLLECGADPTIRNNNAQIAAEVACSHEIRELLLR